VSFDVVWLTLAEADLHEYVPEHSWGQVHALVHDIVQDPVAVGIPDPRPKADPRGRDRIAFAGSVIVYYRVISTREEKTVYIANVRWRD
jgi:hypothetical protein